MSNVWAPVSSSDDNNTANEYRIVIQTNGVVALQKNGINISDNTSIRGQAIWIIWLLSQNDKNFSPINIICYGQFTVIERN